MASTRKSKSELLQELESIQHLLDIDRAPIATAQPTPIGEQKAFSWDEEDELHAAKQQVDALLARITASTSTPPTASASENPFLPQHLRAKLNNPLALSGAKETTVAANQLIDAIVRRALPSFEEELRRHLATLTPAQLEAYLRQKF